MRGLPRVARALRGQNSRGGRGQHGKIEDVGGLSSCEAVLEQLAQDREDMATALREFVQEAHPMVRPRPLARHRDLPAADPPHIRDREEGLHERTEEAAEEAQATGYGYDALLARMPLARAVECVHTYSVR